MSDIENSSSSSEFEGMDRDFTPVNPEARIKTPEKPDAGSKSKAKANSFAQDVKAKAKAKVWDAMHDEKALEKSTAKAINRDKAMQPPKSKPKKNPYLMTEAKAASSSSSRPKANPFILDEAKGASTKSKPKKAPSPHSEDDDDDDESSVELQLKDITNRNKTTVATLREALSVRGLHTKGNRCDVTARFLLYELGLDTTGRDTAMHEYCKKLLGAPMPRLKDTLKDLGQNDVGTNKPQLATRILKATYSAEGDSEQEDKEKEEEDESSSEEGDDGSDQEGPEKTSATPSTSPSSVANGKKRVRVDAEDLDEEEVTPKRQKVVAPNDENEEPSRNQAKVEKPPTLGKPKLTSTTNKSNGVLKMAKPTDDNKKQKRRRSAEADDHDNNPQLQQTKKQKLTEPPKSSKPKDNNNKITAAEIGREVRAKPIPSTLKPKAVAKGSKGKSKKDHDNYFTFAGSLDSRILFENQPVPAQVLDSALRVLTAMGTYKDINAVHDFRHPLPLYKAYRETQYRSTAKKPPTDYLAVQNYYEQKEIQLRQKILEKERKEDEDGFDDEEVEEDQDQKMDDEEPDMEDLIMAGGDDACDDEETAKIYRHAQIVAYYEEVQKEIDEADDLRIKSLHPYEIAFLASIPEDITLESYYSNLWIPKSDEEGSKEQKLRLREEEMALMKLGKVVVGSETFKKIRWSHDGKW